MKSLCIYLGAGPDGERAGQSIILAKTLVFNDYRIVYGGADVGLAGALSDTAPGRLGMGAISVPGNDAVKTDFESLLEIPDAYIARPGGYGALEDVFELLAYARLDSFSKPIAFFAVKDYRLRFGAFLDHAAREGFFRPAVGAMTVSERDLGEIVLESRANGGPCRIKSRARSVFETPYGPAYT